MPRKTFANGFPLPASDLNTYLMEQSVQTYADATARTAALPTPVEGQVSYLADTNTAYVYDGSSWNAVVDAKNYGTVLPNGAAGRNKIINGGFDIWQRGTSFTYAALSDAYQSDRWKVWLNGTTNFTVSRQTFTPGTAPAAGYESEFYHRLVVTSQSGGTIAAVYQKIEDVRTFAGQTVTVSFWAKHDAARTIGARLLQNFGSGGSADVVTTVITSQATTTGWVRYSATVTVPSISGKTIGTGSSLWLLIDAPGNVAQTLDIWGVQLEAGSVATPFSRAGGTLQGELAACQRYLPKFGGNDNYEIIGNGWATTSTNAEFFVPYKVTTRVSPSAIEYSSLTLFDGISGLYPVTGISVAGGGNGTNGIRLVATVASGLTQYRSYELLTNNTTAGYLRLPAEL